MWRLPKRQSLRVPLALQLSAGTFFPPLNIFILPQLVFLGVRAVYGDICSWERCVLLLLPKVAFLTILFFLLLYFRTRLAEKGPSRSGVASVLDFDAPKLSVSGSNNRRRALVVTTAGEVPLNRSMSGSDMHVNGNGNSSMYWEGEDEEDAEEAFSGPIEWRGPSSMSPKPVPPMYLPVEDHLQKLIEKKKETEAKSMILYRSPSELIKDAAQNALYAKLRSSGHSSPSHATFQSSASFQSRGVPSSPMSRISTPPRPSFPMASPNPQFGSTFGTFSNPLLHHHHPHNIVVTDAESEFDMDSASAGVSHLRQASQSPLIIEELPDEDAVPMGDILGQDTGMMMQTPSPSNSPSPPASHHLLHRPTGSSPTTPPTRTSFSDYMMTDDAMGFVHTGNSTYPTSSGFQHLRATSSLTPPPHLAAARAASSSSDSAAIGTTAGATVGDIDASMLMQDTSGMFQTNASLPPLPPTPPPNYSMFNDSTEMDISSTPPPPEENITPIGRLQDPVTNTLSPNRQPLGGFSRYR